MASMLLDHFTADGQFAFVAAAVLLTVFAMLLMLWRPRHVTYRPHDCRMTRCEWLEDRRRL